MVSLRAVGDEATFVQGCVTLRRVQDKRAAGHSCRRQEGFSAPRRRHDDVIARRAGHGCCDLDR
jgi:hypothetical protein